MDARTDVWSLGVLMYECLSGTTPFTGPNYNALMLSILSFEHRPIRELVPAVDAELLDVVEACLMKEREQRVGTAGEVADRLQRIALRLSGDPSAQGLSPRRRATDRLTPRPSMNPAAPVPRGGSTNETRPGRGCGSSLSGQERPSLSPAAPSGCCLEWYSRCGSQVDPRMRRQRWQRILPVATRQPHRRWCQSSPS